MPDDHPSRAMLTSWKAIARFFDRDPRTVQRWEIEEGLPVHRHLHRRQNSVYAFPDELDAWWRERGLAPGTDGASIRVEGDRASQAPPAALDRASEGETVQAAGGPARRIVLQRLAIIALALGVLAAAAALAVRTTTTADWTRPADPRLLSVLDGAVAHSLLYVGPLADVNGDGRNDLVVSGRTTREIYVMLGGSLPQRGALQAAASVTIRGSDNGDYVATDVRDFDGDGFADLLVSVLLHEPDAFRRTGPTYLVRGRRHWSSRLQLPDAADVTFARAEQSDIRMSACRASQSIDLNRDGLEDVVLGGGDYSPAGRASAGGVFIIFGRRDWPRTVDIDRDADITFHGSRAGEALAAACGVGDYNGDGKADLALLGTEHTLWSMLGGRGRTYLFFGRDRWPRILDAGTDADVQVHGLRPQATLAPPSLADLNGDGFDDLIIASSGAPGTEVPGEIAIFYGAAAPSSGVRPMSGADVLITSEHPDAALGAVVTSADLDADGFDDLLIVEEGPGRVHALLGRKEWPLRGPFGELGALELFDGDPGAGGGALSVGDADGDGLPEVMLVASSTDVGPLAAAGRVWIVKPYLPVVLDVRPAAEPNILYLPGVLVARIGGARMPVGDPIDPSSVRLAGASPTRYDWRDFDTDGTEDLQLYFDTRQMRVTPATRQVSLTGRTRQGRLVAGVDSVQVLPGAAK